MSDKLVVEHLYKIFGSHPERADKLIEAGKSQDEIFEETGLTVAVRDASFTVREGEIFVIMGLSGSGKSTLVRMLNRLIEPTRGKILINGHDLTEMSKKELIKARSHEIAMVFQSFALMPHLTAVDNAGFGLEVSGVDVAERRKRALEALDKVGLSANADSYPDELSGGMQQRVGLARALAQDPGILLMDEAFSALDPLIRTEMQDELLRLQEEDSRTIVFISHDLDEAMRIGDRIAIMEGGRVVQVGTPDEILRDPADEYVRSFFRGVDVSQVFSAGDVCRKDGVTVINLSQSNLRATLERMRHYDREFAFVHDKSRHFKGVVSMDSVKAAIDEAGKAAGENGEPQTFIKAYLPEPHTIKADSPLSDALSVVAESPYPVPVVNDGNVYLGAISKTQLLQTLDKAG